MDYRIELFRSFHTNIWFHVMNIVISELLDPTERYNILNDDRFLWDAWSPMHTQYLKTEQHIENLFDPISD